MVKLSIEKSMTLLQIALEKNPTEMGRRLVNYFAAFGYRSPCYIAKEKIEQYKEIYLPFIAYFGESTTFEEAVQACLESGDF